MLTRALAFLGATVVVVGTAGCSSDPQPPGAPAKASQPAPTRPVEFVNCPRADLRPSPPGMELVGRELEALRDNHMGAVLTYERGKQRVKVFSGPDLYDALDDVDFSTRRIQVGRRTFDFSSTTIFPTLYVATVVDERLSAPCDTVGVLTQNIPRGQVLELLVTLQVPPATS